MYILHMITKLLSCSNITNQFQLKLKAGEGMGLYMLLSQQPGNSVGCDVAAGMFHLGYILFRLGFVFVHLLLRAIRHKYYSFFDCIFEILLVIIDFIVKFGAYNLKKLVVKLCDSPALL